MHPGLPPYKISARSLKRSTIYALPIFSLFGPWRLTPGPNFTKREDDLADSEFYHPAKFRPLSPPTPEIFPSDNKQTEKQTVKQTKF